MQRKRSDQRGFTLVETVIVVALVGIFAAVSMPSFLGSLQELRLNGAARKLAYDMRYMREFALSHHDVYGIEFDVSNNSYQLFEVIGGVKTVITNPNTGGNMVIDYDVLPQFSGVSISSAGATEIRIDAFGNPLDSVGAQLTSTVTITLANGSSTKGVRITNQTGFVELV